MTKKPLIDDEICFRAVRKLDKLMDLEDGTGKLVQTTAAKHLVTACQTQERALARPLSAAEAAKAEKSLSNLTPEKLYELQMEMLSGVPFEKLV